MTEIGNHLLAGAFLVAALGFVTGDAYGAPRSQAELVNGRRIPSSARLTRAMAPGGPATRSMAASERCDDAKGGVASCSSHPSNRSMHAPGVPPVGILAQFSGEGRLIHSPR